MGNVAVLPCSCARVRADTGDVYASCARVAEDILRESPNATLLWGVENKTGFVAPDLYRLISRNLRLASHSRYLQCIQGKGARTRRVFGIPTSQLLKQQLRTVMNNFLDGRRVAFDAEMLWSRGDARVHANEFGAQMLNFGVHQRVRADGTTSVTLSGKHVGEDDMVMALMMLVFTVGRGENEFVACTSPVYAL